MVTYLNDELRKDIQSRQVMLNQQEINSVLDNMINSIMDINPIAPNVNYNSYGITQTPTVPMAGSVLQQPTQQATPEIATQVAQQQSYSEPMQQGGMTLQDLLGGLVGGISNVGNDIMGGIGNVTQSIPYGDIAQGLAQPLTQPMISDTGATSTLYDMMRFVANTQAPELGKMWEGDLKTKKEEAVTKGKAKAELEAKNKTWNNVGTEPKIINDKPYMLQVNPSGEIRYTPLVDGIKPKTEKATNPTTIVLNDGSTLEAIYDKQQGTYYQTDKEGNITKEWSLDQIKEVNPSKTQTTVSIIKDDANSFITKLDPDKQTGIILEGKPVGNPVNITTTADGKKIAVYRTIPEKERQSLEANRNLINELKANAEEAKRLGIQTDIATGLPLVGDWVTKFKDPEVQALIANINKVFQKYRKETTGAQASYQELENLKLIFPNLAEGDIKAFLEKTNGIVNNLARSEKDSIVGLERNNYYTEQYKDGFVDNVISRKQNKQSDKYLGVKEGWKVYQRPDGTYYRKKVE